MKSYSILGVRVDDVTMSKALDLIQSYVESPAARCRQIASINPEFIMTARRNPDFAGVLAHSDLNLPDGANLVRAAHFLGYPLRERVAGSDLTPRLAARAADRGWPVFFLGAAPGVAEEAARRLCEKYPALRVAGTYAGSPSAKEEKEIVQRVNASGAAILLVAYGAPAQDFWIARNREQLRARAAIGVGGTLDFVAGRVARAPLWLQRAGLEWLFRLALQPGRIRRQAVLPFFVFLVLLERMRRGGF